MIIENVANDDVFKTVDMYFRGLWDKNRTIEELRYYKMNDQISDSTNLITEMEATNRKNNKIIYIFSLGLIVAFCLILASKIYPIMRASQSTEQTVQ